MNYSAKTILSVLALLFAVCSLIWPAYPLTTVAVVLLAVINLIP